MLTEIQNLDSWKFVLLLSCAVGLAVFIIRTIHNLTIKFGDKSVTFNKTQTQLVKVVTDYADFKYKLISESYEINEDLHAQAKRVSNLYLSQYLQRLTSEYFTSISSIENSIGKEITLSVFPLLTQLLRSKMLKFLMEVYEMNHLSNRSDEELKRLAHQKYLQLSDLFREMVLTSWLPTMLPYEGVRKVSEEISSFTEDLLFSILSEFRNLSLTRIKSINLIDQIDTKVRTNVQKTGALPENYLSVLSNLYIPEIGLNEESINNWLSSSDIK